MKSLAPTGSRGPLKFRMPTAENLVPIRLDIEVDGKRIKDAFTWNLNDPDLEVVSFAKRTVKDLKLPPTSVTQIAQSIQTQLAEFRSYEGQEMFFREKIVPLKLDFRVNNTVIKDQFFWDVSNFESDPDEFARRLCTDLNIKDPEVGPAIAVAIREQLYEFAVHSITSAREYRMGKKARKGAESATPSKWSNNATDLMKLFSNKASVVRKRKDWCFYEAIIDVLSNEEAEALDAKDERNFRFKRKLDEQKESFQTTPR